jgi:hypothetical protein
MGVILAAILLSGSRLALMYMLLSTAAVSLVYVRQFLATRSRFRKIVVSVAGTLTVALVAVVVLAAVYPAALQSRIAFYQQTLSPSSPTSQLSWRAWGYPAQEFAGAFSRFPNWHLGYGTGTCSLGGQYLTRILGVDSPGVGVESGYGNLVLEMGIPGLMLWVVWTVALIVSAWKITRQLRHSAVFPVALSIFCFALILLFGTMAQSLTGYQNFVSNAYLWLLTGVLFHLPKIGVELK